MYMKPKYISLFAAYWNKQGLLILSHVNSPGDIVYFALPPQKDLKRGRGLFFCITGQNALSRRAAKMIQRRKSNLKPSLFYSNKCMQKCLLFHVQIKARVQATVVLHHPDHQSRAGSWLLPGSPRSLLLKPRGNSCVMYTVEESWTPKAGEERSKRSQALLRAGKPQRGLASWLGKAPTAEDWIWKMGGVGTTWRMRCAVQGHRWGPLNWLGKDFGARSIGRTLGEVINHNSFWGKQQDSKGKDWKQLNDYGEASKQRDEGRLE